jgi:predicted restriction endonuclease
MSYIKSRFEDWMENRPELYEEFVEQHCIDGFSEWAWTKFEESQAYGEDEDTAYERWRDEQAERQFEESRIPPPSDK